MEYWSSCVPLSLSCIRRIGGRIGASFLIHEAPYEVAVLLALPHSAQCDQLDILLALIHAINLSICGPKDCLVYSLANSNMDKRCRDDEKDGAEGKFRTRPPAQSHGDILPCVSLTMRYFLDYSSSEGEGSRVEEAAAIMALRKATTSSDLDPLSTRSSSDLAAEVIFNPTTH